MKQILIAGCGDIAMRVAPLLITRYRLFGLVRRLERFVELRAAGITNLVHANDLARIVVSALRKGKPNRIYHASNDSEIKMGDYLDAVADAHDLSRPLRLPRAEVERSVSPALWSFMNESRRLTNERMKKELGVVLRYPTVADALVSKIQA